MGCTAIGLSAGRATSSSTARTGASAEPSPPQAVTKIHTPMIRTANHGVFDRWLSADASRAVFRSARW